MGFFDGLGTRLQDTVSKAATGATATVFDYFNATTQDALVKVGVAPSGNLTEAEIAAGKTGAPPQPTVVPSNKPLSAISAASPMTFIEQNKSMLLIAAAAVVAYMLIKKR